MVDKRWEGPTYAYVYELSDEESCDVVTIDGLDVQSVVYVQYGVYVHYDGFIHYIDKLFHRPKNHKPDFDKKVIDHMIEDLDKWFGWFDTLSEADKRDLMLITDGAVTPYE